MLCIVWGWGLGSTVTYQDEVFSEDTMHIRCSVLFKCQCACVSISIHIIIDKEQSDFESE